MINDNTCTVKMEFFHKMAIAPYIGEKSNLWKSKGLDPHYRTFCNVTDALEIWKNDDSLLTSAHQIMKQEKSSTSERIRAQTNSWTCRILINKAHYSLKVLSNVRNFTYTIVG